MQIALYNDLILDVEEALYEYGKDQEYICPCCKENVILKAGSVKLPYFSHLKNSNCNYSDYSNEMSEWHKWCQSLFPKEYREIIITKKLKEIYVEDADDFEDDEVETHIADICYKNYVIEFQHSPIDSDTFMNRTYFYLQAGYKLIWVFDWNNKVYNGTLDFYYEDYKIAKWIYKYAPKTFRYYRPQNYKKNMWICFSYDNNDDDDENLSCLERIDWAIPKNYDGHNDEADYSRIVTTSLTSIETLAKYILSK